MVAAFFILSLSALLAGCSGEPSTPGTKFPGSDKEIIEFNIPARINTALSADARGTISGTEITCVVPHDADLASLAAEYVANGTKVEVAGKTQVNGVTRNNFTSPVTYRVYAADKSYLDYTTTVNRAPSTAKRLTSFRILGVDGIIDDSGLTIALVLPPHTARSSLTALFSIEGRSVTVGGTEQESGVTKNDFRAPVRYVVNAEDGSSSEYTVTADVAPGTEKEITSFVFRSADNSQFTEDVPGIIAGNVISAVLPYGSSRAGLAAYFESPYASVTADGEPQTAGSTKNDFTSPLTYRVTAEDGSHADYTVNVTVAKNSAKEMLSFTLDGERGVITGQDIAVTFSAGKNLAALIASFTTSGSAVLVGATPQESGTTANDFTAPVAYTVRAENDTTSVYTVTVTRSAEIPGMWNFGTLGGPGYTVSGATLVNTAEGSGLQFDGTDDYMLVPDSAAYTLASAGSLEVIMKARSFRSFAGVVHKGEQRNFSDESFSLQFWGTDVLRMILTNDAGASIYADSAEPLLPDTWYHVVAAWDSTKLTLYINGVEADSVANTIGAVRDSAGGLVVGAQLSTQKYNTTYGNLCFDGIIDRVVVYNRALGADEALSHYRTFFPEQGSPLTAYIPRVVRVNVAPILAAVAALLLAIALVRRLSRGQESA